MKDANDAASALPWDQFRESTEELVRRDEESACPPGVFSLRDMAMQYNRYKPELIKRLIRRGEVGVFTGPSKAGKTHVRDDMILSVASGGYFLGRDEWKCEHGRVLLFDNELHPESITMRLMSLVRSRKLDLSVCDNIHIMPMRGQMRDIRSCGRILKQVAKWKPDLIIFDALYRMYWEGFNENDNAHMSQLGNLLDDYASSLDASILVIHHLSKGTQSDKAISDLGAGGGALNRAVDVIIGMRPHADKRNYVLGTEFRSLPPIDPVVIEWEYPSWRIDYLKNPEELKGSKIKRDIPRTLGSIDMTDEALASYLPAAGWMTGAELDRAVQDRLCVSRTEAQRLRQNAVARHDLVGLCADDGEWRKSDVPFIAKASRGSVLFAKAGG